jgi:hypothetical protein
MTPSQVWIYLRWPLALLGLLAIVQYALPRLPEAVAGMVEFDPSGSILAPTSESESDLPIPEAEIAAATLQPGSGAVADGTAQPIADFAVADTVADIDVEAMELSEAPGDAVVIAFDLPAGDPSCMASMTLSLTVADAAGATEVGVWPGTIAEPVEVVDDQLVEGDLRATPTPMATVLVEQAGPIQVDVLGGFQQYFSLDLPAEQPFVLVLQATTPVEPGGGVAFASANAQDETVPTLSWTGTPGCPAGAVPAATPTTTG